MYTNIIIPDVNRCPITLIILRKNGYTFKRPICCNKHGFQMNLKIYHDQDVKLTNQEGVKS